MRRPDTAGVHILVTWSVKATALLACYAPLQAEAEIDAPTVDRARRVAATGLGELDPQLSRRDPEAREP